ncbi:MAG: formate dehydrogenase accessory sulfurtransferase FdhD [Geminicoccaceae bacterium]
MALVYNGVSHAVLLASPAELEDLGRGFTLAEGIVADPAEIGTVEVVDMVLGLEVRLRSRYRGRKRWSSGVAAWRAAAPAACAA